MTTSATTGTFARLKTWAKPTLSPEHGAYIVLGVSFVLGAAAAQRWTLTTTLALLCACLAFQAEHPLVLQIKQRSSWKPRFLLWGGLYGGLALALAALLAWKTPTLGWLYLGAVLAFGIDAIAVYHRQQRSIANELLTFAAVCLATPLAYGATTGTLANPTVWALWLLNTLFFSSAIFTVKLRKPKTSSLTPGLIYHGLATLLVLALAHGGWLPWLTAAAFGVVLAKYGFILLFCNWYRTTKIQWVAVIETLSALLFMGIAALAFLPVHL